ncbi:MAG: excisionase family DNA-binding protein [Candidatus Limnocylindrales bacterium]
MSTSPPTLGIERAMGELVAAIRAELAAQATALAPMPDRLLSVDEAADALGIGRSRLYEEIGTGRLRSLKVGRRRLVPASAITAYIEALVDGERRGSR